jgi:peptidoglycan/LPS O-acetylase OafA/YrhL
MHVRADAGGPLSTTLLSGQPILTAHSTPGATTDRAKTWTRFFILAEPIVQRSHTLDAIRGIAILQVVVWHYLVPSLNHHGSSLSLLLSASLNLTWTGVDLFFVLSGYLIGGILMDNRQASNMFGVFYARRVLRILPLYLLTIALFQAFGSPDSLWPYLTFTQNMMWAADGHWGPTWTGVTWSLAVEEQFYLVLPLIIWCTRPKFLPIVLLTLCATAPIARWLCAHWLYSSHHASYLLMPCRMDALFGGVLVAWFVRRHQFARHAIYLYAAASILGFGLIIMLCTRQQDLSTFMITIGYTWIAAFYASILLLTASARHPIILAKARTQEHPTRTLSDGSAIQYPFRILGLGAYAVYLLHEPLLSVLTRVGIRWSLTLLLATCATLAAAWLSWRFIEQPCITYGQQRFRYRVASGDQRSGEVTLPIASD